jgi:hypothetical protein
MGRPAVSSWQPRAPPASARSSPQSNSLWMERTGDAVADESARIEPHPPADAAWSVAALRHVESFTTGLS